MKKFLFLFLSLFFIGGLNANAEKVYADLSQYGDKWDGTDVSFSWTATYGNQLTPTLDALGLPKGDLRNWQKLVVVVDELSNCDFFRVLVYSGDDSDHSNTFKCTKTGSNEFTLSGNVDFLNNVTKIVLSGSNWEDSQSGTWAETPASFKVKEVYLEKPDIVYIEASEVFEAPAGTFDVKNLTGTETGWAGTVTYPKEFAVQGKSFGNGDGSNESTHVNIDGYDYICFDVTTATNNTAGLRVWIWDGEAGGAGSVVTLYAKPIADYKTVAAEGTWTTASKITGVGTYVAKVSGYKYLKGVKAANDWGSSAAVVSMAYMCTGDPVAYVPTGKYSLVGEATGSASLSDALADVKATCYDATGVTGTGVDLSGAANLNALFVANAGVLANTSNVIVDGVCANLQLTDFYPFKAPADFTATEATYSRNMEASAATLCLPFAATIPAGVEAYTLVYNGGEKATATPVETTTIPANTPVLIIGSGMKEFAGSSVAIDADADPVVGSLTGVFQDTTVPQNSYVLQNGTSGLGFYKVESDDIVAKPFRAYLTTIFTSEARGFIGFEGATGINEVNVNKAAAKTGKIYNLNGQIVSKPSKGLFIVDGKVVSF